jgi:hypothetical protein
MAYGPRQPYRRPTVLVTLETRGAKGMHTRPCGNHFLRSFAGRSIQPKQSLGRASSCRKAQGGHNHLRHTPGDASGGETTMKANT